MTKQEIIDRINSATTEQLEAISSYFDGNGLICVRLVHQKEAARMLGYKSAMTIQRMIDAGLLKMVTTPAGFKKVTLQSIHDYIKDQKARPYTPTEAQKAHRASGWQRDKNLRKA